MIATKAIEPAIVLQRLLRRKWSIILGGVAGLVLAAATGLPVRYAASGLLLVARTAPTANETSDRLTQTDVLLSPSLLSAVAQRLDLADRSGLVARWHAPAVLEQAAAAVRRDARALAALAGLISQQAPSAADRLAAAVKDLRTHLTVTSNESSRVLGLTLQAGQAKLAADVVNEVMQQYLAFDHAARMATTEGAYEELKAQVDEAAREVKSADAAVDEFRQHHDLISLQAGLPAALQFNDQQARLAAATVDLAQAQATLEAARRGGGKLSSPALQALNERETDVLQRIALGLQLGPSNPRRMAMQDELLSVRSQIDLERSKVLAALDRDVDVAQQKVAALQSKMGSVQTSAIGADTAQYDMTHLVREADMKRASFQELRSRAETLRLANLQVPVPQIVSMAIVPSRPEPSGKPLLMAAGFALGAILVATTVLLHAVMGRTLASSSELAYATGMPALGSLPLVARKGRRGVVSLAMVGLGSVIPETLRGMRVTIEASQTEPRAKLVLVTSAEAREGKTTVAVALARRAAGDGFRVLLIDADLRRPATAKLLGLATTTSLEEALQRGGDFAAKVQTDPASSLDCLVARGDHPNPAMLLSSPSFSSLMAFARQSYDFVFVDSPPVLRVADPIMLSRWADVVVLAVRANNTTQSMVMEALSRFPDLARSRIMTCLTRAAISRQDRAGYFSGYSRAARL